jgi:hypothetical protein
MTNLSLAPGDDRLTSLLAVQVMGWGLAPDRYLLRDRRWMPRWRFQPMVRLEDAFQLLEAAKTEACSIQLARGSFDVKVQVGGQLGEFIDKSAPVAITLAVAMALEIEPN